MHRLPLLERSRLRIYTTLFGACLIFGTTRADEADFFEAKIRPVLVAHCYECHSQPAEANEKLRGGLRLDDRELAFKGGESGVVIVPGMPDESPLLAAIRYDSLEMPPKGKLSDNLVVDFERWIQDGAHWPETQTPSHDAKATAIDKAATDYEFWRSTHWSWKPIATPPIAKSDNDNWSQNKVDLFIDDRLREEQLSPSGEADRATLIRRLYFDLLGLPPKYDDVVRFVNDPSVDAYEQLVDRLLSSPAYGERWARHWLDVARYADNGGFNSQTKELYTNYPYAYTYRDYVIRAFNHDLPYDQFIVEQLAADKLKLGEDNRALAALGFLTLGDKSFGVSREDQIDDCIDTVTRGLMGITVSCARCHDHKYDPIPTEDYYSLFGIFRNSNISVASRLHTEEKSEVLPLIFRNQAERDRHEALTQDAERQLEIVKAKFHDEALKHCFTRTADYLLAASGFADEQQKNGLDNELVERWKKFLDKAKQDKLELFQLWFKACDLQQRCAVIALERFLDECANDIETSGPLRDKFQESGPTTIRDLADLYESVLSAVRSETAAPNDQIETVKTITSMKEWPWNLQRDDLLKRKIHTGHDRLEKLQAELNRVKFNSPRAVSLTDRDKIRPSKILIRGNPSKQGDEVPRRFLALLSANRREFTDGSGRLELAHAIVAPENPLTARTIVNRLWYHHFGRGFVEDNGDFGTRSDPPTHLELLDYLATELIRNDWSIKKVQRSMVLSNTYRQRSSDRDEGVSTDPENRFYWRMNRRRLEFESLRDAILRAVDELDLAVGGRAIELWESNRRTLYGYINRYRIEPTYETFDFPSSARTATKRNKTLAPQQSLFLMNSPFAEMAANRIVESISHDSVPDEVRIHELYRRTLSRNPTEAELQAAEQFLQDGGDVGWTSIAHALMMCNEFIYVD